MMSSKFGAGKKTGESSGSGKLLKEIDSISKALYLDKTSPKNLLTVANARSKSIGKTYVPDSKSNSKDSNENPSSKDKKSIWNWRPLKAFSHIRNRRFNCCFSLQVHLIEGFPSTFDDTSFCVYWKRRDWVLATRPAKVVEHTAEFEENLTYTCSVYGSRNGPHYSAKYEAKHFLVYVSVVGASELDLGKHRVDLTRLLPLTLEELEEEKSSGKWTTSFKLSGMAKGAVLNVSFGYKVVGDNSSATRDNHNAPNSLTLRQNSLSLTKQDIKSSQVEGKINMTHNGNPSSFSRSYSSRTVDVVKDLREVWPTSKLALSSSIDILYQKHNEEKTCSQGHDEPELDLFTENLQPNKPDAYPLSDPGKGNSEECEGNEEITRSSVHDKSELNAFQESLDSVKSNVCSLSHPGKENPEKCEGNEFSVVDQGKELSSNEPFKVEESTMKTFDASAVDSTITIFTAEIRLSTEDNVKHESLDGTMTVLKKRAIKLWFMKTLMRMTFLLKKCS
ncbi:hypothetical protein L6164_011777 [Bauhinia variegata]|uniref:Uncharacterized protein n=1 Tax=Bauhinia variegata TaxID=167791 RepID=A0ACB9P7Y7_BAUVA|nr:hypothetical protein L6164_011777 [Bauhinia variegata]